MSNLFNKGINSMEKHIKAFLFTFFIFMFTGTLFAQGNICPLCGYTYYGDRCYRKHEITIVVEPTPEQRAKDKAEAERAKQEAIKANQEAIKTNIETQIAIEREKRDRQKQIEEQKRAKKADREEHAQRMAESEHVCSCGEVMWLADKKEVKSGDRYYIDTRLNTPSRRNAAARFEAQNANGPITVIYYFVCPKGHITKQKKTDE